MNSREKTNHRGIAKISPTKRLFLQEINDFKTELEKIYLTNPNLSAEEINSLKEVNIGLKGKALNIGKKGEDKLVFNYDTQLFIICRPIIIKGEKFNAEEELKKIKGLGIKEKKKALKKWKQKLKKQLDIMAEIPEKIKILAEGYDYNKTYIYEIVKDVIKKAKINFKDLSQEQRRYVIYKIFIYIKSKSEILKHLEKDEYNNNHKKLLSDILGINESILKGEITGEINGANLIFYIGNEDDYSIVFNSTEEEKKESITDKAKLTGGFSTNRSEIKKLKGNISYINGAKIFKTKGRKTASYYRMLYKQEKTFYENRISETRIHETRHRDNRIIMKEPDIEDVLLSAKDEIIAYIYGGRLISDLRENLFRTGKNGLYDYYEDEKGNLLKYQKLRDIYEKELSRILEIAEYMKYAKIPNYIDLLTITPVRQWVLLEDLYLNSKTTKFKIHINKFIHKIFKKA